MQETLDTSKSNQYQMIDISYNTLKPRKNSHYIADDISDAFLWMKMHEFRLKFHWSVFYVPSYQHSDIASDNGLATRQEAIIWTNYVWITDAYMMILLTMCGTSLGALPNYSTDMNELLQTDQDFLRDQSK